MKIAPVPALDSNTKISSGGFGTIFVDPRSKNTCIKIFNAPLTGEDAEILLSLTAIRSWARPSDADLLTSRFAWPIDVFGENGLIHGYSMPLAQQSCYFDLTVVRKETRQPLQLKYLFDGAYWASAAVRSAKPEASVQDRIEMAIDAVDSVNALHTYGLSYGDVSGNNIVARLDAKPGVFFFDVDSITPTERRANTPLRSPGWETPENLGPQEIDRSRLAILITRLLSEDLNAWPDEDLPSLLESTSAKALGERLRACFEKGDSRSFLQLTSSLRSLRSTDRSRRSVEVAQKSGFARRVILEVAGSRTKDLLELRKAAGAHLLNEQSIEEARGFERRRMEKRFKSTNQSFRLDILPVSASLKPLRTLEELRELIFEACFDEIGLQFSARGLGPLETSSLTNRAVERALIEVGAEKLDVQPTQGEAVLTFPWPDSDLVNAAELTISLGQDRKRHLLTKPHDGRVFHQVLRVPSGGRGKASLTLCAQSPSGTRVRSPLSVETEFRIPPTPRPVAPRPTPQRRASTNPAPQSAYLLVDLEAEERERAAAWAHRRKQKRKRLLLSAIPVVMATATGIGYLLGAFTSSASDEEIALTEETLVETEPVRGLVVRNSVLSIETESLGVQADSASISISSDGLQWSSVQLVTLNAGVTTVDLSNSPSKFYKVDFVALNVNLAPTFVVSEIYEGLAQIPSLVAEGNSIRAEWVRANPSPSGQILRFNYQYTRASRPDLIAWVYQTQTDATSSFYLPAGEQGFKIEIQVVYQDRSTGPWIVVGQT